MVCSWRVVCECDWYVMMLSLPYVISLICILLYRHLVLYLLLVWPFHWLTFLKNKGEDWEPSLTIVLEISPTQVKPWALLAKKPWWLIVMQTGSCMVLQAVACQGWKLARKTWARGQILTSAYTQARSRCFVVTSFSEWILIFLTLTLTAKHNYVPCVFFLRLC